ncbi:MAG: NUDIX domain-containing protein [Lachnospiraceae bacterium]|nr:NUDIX domain-containing protein [Lachnospiraceae bacterium]
MRGRADMEDLLVWVDENDHEIGSGEKMDTHIRGQLHRAFSVFLFRESDGKLLIHRRAEGKYHSGGLWTNSCCSHPRRGEDLFDAVIRRMREELGFALCDDEADGRVDCRMREESDFTLHEGGTDDSLTAATGAYGGLSELGRFQYYQKYEDCAEHEIDHVFYLTVPDAQITLSPDPEEISEIQWISIDDLLVWMTRRPEDFTAWFAPALEIVREYM